MRHGSLFSGIGGFDLAAEWMGWENIFHCEWNPFGQRVLKYYWPKAETFTDITKSDFTKYANKIDILTGGFPCQPYSIAGKRKGKEDERHLWPEMLRAIREIQPRWIVGENVPGLINWSGGMVLKEIKADLEDSGFEIIATLIIPACGKNAPHRRDRLWIVANRSEVNGKQITNNRKRESGEQIKKGRQVWSEFTSTGRSGNASNSDDKGIQRRQASGDIKTEEQDSEQFVGRYNKLMDWSDFPTVSPIRFGNDGLSFDLDTTTISKTDWLKGSLEAAGNSVVPQVVYEIFKAIEMTEQMMIEEQNLKTEHRNEVK